MNKMAGHFALLFLASYTMGCTGSPSLFDSAHPPFAEVAPDSFDVEMVTTKGTVVVRVRRDWSPNGVDRFHALVSNRFYEDVAFHRTIRNYVAQFGLHGDSAVTAAWTGQFVPDDSVRVPNHRGTLAFARGGPNTRSTQLYFNLVDNTPRLDTLSGFGFPPIGRVIDGINILDSLNWEYSGTRGGQEFPGPRQDSIRTLGNAYLHRNFPRLDYILSAGIAKSW